MDTDWENPKFGLQAPRGRAGQDEQDERDKQGRAGRTGPGRAEQTATCSQQPVTLKQLTAEGGDHRTTHLAHRSTCCSRTASRERASAEGLESIEGLRVSVSLCLRVFTSSRLHVFPPFFTFAQRVLPKVGPSSRHETSAACHPICPDHFVGTRILDEFVLFYLQNDKSKSYGFHVTARSSFPTAACQLPSSTFRDS